MSTHASLAPSGAAQWGNCPGSIKAQANFEDVDSDAAKEGNAAHWVIEGALTLGVLPEDMRGKAAPNGVIIDEKIVEGAQVMVDEVMRVQERWGGVGVLKVEVKLNMPNIHPTDCWGTCDAAYYVPDKNVLYIWDYKHGYRDVDVRGNLQLALYLNGLADFFGIDGLAQQSLNVVSRIVQPFSYSAQGPVKTEGPFLMSDLRATWNRLSAAGHKALSDDPTLSTGPWCRDCLAVGTCSAARIFGYNFVDAVNQPYAMDDMRGPDLETERNMLKTSITSATARLQAIEDLLRHRIERGDEDLSLTLQRGKGHEQWQIPDEQVIALCGQLGVDARKKALKTPKQTRDGAPKEVRPVLEKIMKRVVGRKTGSVKLVEVGDSKIAHAFKNYRK